MIRFHHAAYSVNDVDDARAFYIGILGFREIERPPSLYSAGIWLANDTMEIHLVEDHDYKGPGLGNGLLPEAKHFAFWVDDLEPFRDYLIEKKIRVSDVIKLEYNVHQFFALDYSDNSLEIISRER